MKIRSLACAAISVGSLTAAGAAGIDTTDPGLAAAFQSGLTVQTFESLAAESFRRKFDDKRVDMRVIIPAFMISELRRSFEIGFLIILPFLVIDMIVATLTMSMGMMMLPPTVISLPFKILFFVLIDGWNMLTGSLVRSFF